MEYGVRVAARVDGLTAGYIDRGAFVQEAATLALGKL